MQVAALREPGPASVVRPRGLFGQTTPLKATFRDVYAVKVAFRGFSHLDKQASIGQITTESDTACPLWTDRPPGIPPAEVPGIGSGCTEGVPHNMTGADTRRPAERPAA